MEPSRHQTTVRTVGAWRLLAITQLVLGVLMLMLALTASVSRAIIDPSWEILGYLYVGLIGGLLVWNGVKNRKLPRSPQRMVPRLPVKAFEVSDGMIHFPQSLTTGPAESWLLGDTGVEVVERQSRTFLRLTHPGRKPRVFSDAALALAPRDIAARMAGLEVAPRDNWPMLESDAGPGPRQLDGQWAQPPRERELDA